MLEPEGNNTQGGRHFAGGSTARGVIQGLGLETRRGEISDPFMTIRFTEAVVEPSPIISSLEILATHPKLPGYSRLFDLSHLLHEGHRRSPQTVRQVINPRLTPESRLDAIRTLVVEICRTTGRVPVTRQLPTPSPSSEQALVDELEPAFELRGELLTELADVVRGYSRRAVTALRNGKPLVQFLLIEQEGELRHASMVLHPAQLEWPMLDDEGRYVTEKTVDRVIHDLTHHLRQMRNAPILRVVESLANEVKTRVEANPEAPDSLRSRRFSQEAWAAYRDERGFPLDFEPPAISPMLAPSEYPYIARELPDGRACWIHHDNRSDAADILRLTGFSRSGGRFSVRLQYPSLMSWNVGAACERLLSGDGWPDLNPALKLLRESRRGGIAFSYSTSPESYPAAINALMDSLRATAPHSNAQLGLWRDLDGRMEPYLGEVIGEFIKGRLPVHGCVGGSDPAFTWVFHAMLDEDLHGTVLFVNGTQGCLMMRSIQGGDTSARGRALIHTLKELYEAPEHFLGSFHGKSAFEVTLQNLPHWGATEQFARVNDFALAMWRGARSAGHFAFAKSSGFAPWRAQRGENGNWVLALESVQSVRDPLPYVIACVIAESGVREVLVSYGRRDPLGGLWGRRITSSSGGMFFDESEVEALTRALSDLSVVATEQSLSQRVHNVLPRAEVSLPRSMRVIDPEASRKDLLPRLVRWFKGLW